MKVNSTSKQVGSFQQLYSGSKILIWLHINRGKCMFSTLETKIFTPYLSLCQVLTTELMTIKFSLLIT